MQWHMLDPRLCERQQHDNSRIQNESRAILRWFITSKAQTPNSVVRCSGGEDNDGLPKGWNQKNKIRLLPFERNTINKTNVKKELPKTTRGSPHPCLHCPDRANHSSRSWWMAMKYWITDVRKESNARAAFPADSAYESKFSVDFVSKML